jgi:pSer/pThr/pTyr-binding forkhead associated (FHA) protein
MQVKLKVISGSHEGREIAVNSEKFLIGRSDLCQLRPKSESVSRKHCIIVLRDGRVLVQDLKSRNGTYVNDKRLPPDKAKVLTGGDRLRVGKLEFDVLIEHGLQAAKKPEVADVGDAAARTVEAGASESKFEEVDVTSWLDEADQIDRVRKLSDPETRQFRMDEAKERSESNPESGEISVGDSSSSDDPSSSSGLDEKKASIRRKKKQPPGKLPENMKKVLTENSRDAADDALRRFFSGQ